MKLGTGSIRQLKVAAVASSFGLAVAALTPGIAPLAEAAAPCNVYGGWLQGQVQDNSGVHRFAVQQYVVVRGQGYARNPVEFALYPVGDLNATGQIGNALLMTNSAWAHNAGVRAAHLDVAHVSRYDANTWTFQLDPGTSLILPPPNTFAITGITPYLGGLGFIPNLGGGLGSLLNSVSSSSLGTGFVTPYQGGGWFRLLNNGQSVSGQVDVIGVQQDNYNNQGRYTAQFQVPYLGQTAC